ncbi:ankyrin repeat domain-containing protein 6-like [Octopus sinensis]|uniref:Ankyrin repeat domain-containing protein 6-like n=1 Tax=Octopus sinensis TaxID=2607531 RepID=A0A6P7U1X8_9MOLL|nr:ankyrin repeat domain-containing protein 6-like [Octopus sinensis]
MSKIVRCDSSGRTALHFAATKNNVDMMVILIEFDSSVINKCDKMVINALNIVEGNTALHYSCAVGSAEHVKVLLVHSADVTVQNLAGNTALHVACMNNNYDVVELLIASKCDVNVLNNEKYVFPHLYFQSALHYVMKMSPSVYKALVDSSASILPTVVC